MLYFCLNLNPRKKITLREFASRFDFVGLCVALTSSFPLPFSPTDRLSSSFTGSFSRLALERFSLGSLSPLIDLVSHNRNQLEEVSKLNLISFHSLPGSDKTTIALLVVGIVCFAIGMVNEGLTKRTPLFPPRLFRTRTTTLTLAITTLQSEFPFSSSLVRSLSNITSSLQVSRIFHYRSISRLITKVSRLSAKPSSPP